MKKEQFQEIISGLQTTKKEKIDNIQFEELPAPQQYTALVIDGGSAEIFTSASTSIYLIRLYARGTKRRRTEKFITITRKENTLEIREVGSKKQEVGGKKYEVRSTTEENEHMTVQLPDRFTEELGFSYGANMYRRNEELRLALSTLQEEQPEILIIDGSFDTKTREEQELLEQLKTECTKKNIPLIGFSKSCTYTHEGRPLTVLIEEQSPIPTWSASYKGTRFVKLHAKAPTPFRVDIHGDVRKALSYLHWNARDIATPGYPYALIDADKMAQVTQREQEKLRFTLHAYSNETYKKDEEGLKYHETMNRF